MNNDLGPLGSRAKAGRTQGESAANPSWSLMQAQGPSAGLLVSDMSGRKNALTRASSQPGTESSQEEQEQELCRGRPVMPVTQHLCNGAEPKATLSLLCKFPNFYAFLPHFDEGSTPQIQIPASGTAGQSESFFLRLKFLSPACLCCPTHFSAPARNWSLCKLVLVRGRALETSGTVLCSQVLPR